MIHFHTEFSDASVCEMEKVINDAIKMNLEEICITDHVDYGIKLDWCDEKVKRAVDGLNLALEQGEIFGFLGSNGGRDSGHREIHSGKRRQCISRINTQISIRIEL